jgi:hypothetical protein
MFVNVVCYVKVSSLCEVQYLVELLLELAVLGGWKW